MIKNEPLIYAHCDDVGRINFGPVVPTGCYPLCYGTQTDMEIVKRLAHQDGDRFYVPGNLEAKDREVVFEKFAEACCERAEKPIPLEERRKVREYQSYDEWLRETMKCPDCG